MTIDEALAYGRSQLSPSPTPQLDARLLLQHILAVPLSYLLAHGQEPLTAVQARQFHTLVNRARGQEPIPYLTGKAPFFDFELRVNTDVLIPRPETEHLVERAQAWASRRGHIHIVDVGTGSGCIAIALARQLPAATVTAVDISAAALAVARQICWHPSTFDPT
jgi:release factor glutamine methyltransferase